MIDSIAYSNKIRGLCTEYYTPKKTLSDGTANPDDHPAMRSEAMSAANCMVSIARIFKLLETFDPSLVVLVITDTTFGLSENQFWKQHGATLVPTFKAALHAYLSALTLSADKAPSAEKQEIISIQKRQWHSLFLVAYDCLYGVSNTVLISAAFSQDIAKAV